MKAMNLKTTSTERITTIAKILERREAEDYTVENRIAVKYRGGLSYYGLYRKRKGHEVKSVFGKKILVLVNTRPKELGELPLSDREKKLRESPQ